MTPTTVEDIYKQLIKTLPPADRLRLATLILSEFPPQAITDYREEWTAEDEADFSAHTWKHIEQQDDATAG